MQAAQREEFKTDRQGNVTSLNGFFTVWVQHSQNGEPRNLFFWSFKTLPNLFLHPTLRERGNRGFGSFSYDLWSIRLLRFREYLGNVRLHFLKRLLAHRTRKHSQGKSSLDSERLPQCLKDASHQ